MIRRQDAKYDINFGRINCLIFYLTHRYSIKMKTNINRKKNYIIPGIVGVYTCLEWANFGEKPTRKCISIINK